MSSKWKRMLIALVLPMVVTITICGIFYYKNAHSTVLGLKEKYEEYQEFDGVILTKKNWNEYFEYVEEYVTDIDEQGNAVSIRLDAYYKMKDEYYEKISKNTERIIFIVNADGTVKEYEILNPKTGEWKYTGKNAKFESDFYKLYMAYMENNREMCFWEPDTNKAEIAGNSYQYNMKEEMLILSIDTVELLAVEGRLQFE